MTLCDHCLCYPIHMLCLEHTADCSTTTHLAATSLLQACDSMITVLLVDTQWYAVVPCLVNPTACSTHWFCSVSFCFRAMCLGIVYSLQPVNNYNLLGSPKKKNPSLCVKSIVVEDVVEPVSCLIVQTTVFHLTKHFSLFLTIEAKLLKVTQTDVLWQARSNAVMHE